jgi:hypothetical protein
MTSVGATIIVLLIVLALSYLAFWLLYRDR